MNSEDLFKTFHADQVEEAELNQVLLDHFHGAQQINQDEIAFPGHPTDYALRLIYAKGRLARIVRGPRLTEEDKSTIERRVGDELIASSGTKVGAVILFANVPIEGWFRYDELFQIMPVPPDAPRPSFLIADHPFLVEFRFPDSTNWMIRNIRRATRGRQLELVLSGILKGSIHSIG